jgi:hypothetical protein
MPLKLRFVCESAEKEHGEKVKSVLAEGAAKPTNEVTKTVTQSGKLKAFAHADNTAAFAEQGHPAAEFVATGVNVDAGVTFVKGHEYVITVEDVTAGAAVPTAPVVVPVVVASPVAPIPGATTPAVT